ncbi:PAF1 [Symbiodinium pilosum]|uniref:PAF1 protein n=1 Tax=Symbiodinium pilosum TaxID=2952 RepID=A0A812LGF0_SYMPI|nr:PAF1 [Symbiodinium pilosum]
MPSADTVLRNRVSAAGRLITLLKPGSVVGEVGYLLDTQPLPTQVAVRDRVRCLVGYLLDTQSKPPRTQSSDGCLLPTKVTVRDRVRCLALPVTEVQTLLKRRPDLQKPIIRLVSSSLLAKEGCVLGEALEDRRYKAVLEVACPMAKQPGVAEGVAAYRRRNSISSDDHKRLLADVPQCPRDAFLELAKSSKEGRLAYRAPSQWFQRGKKNVQRLSSEMFSGQFTFKRKRSETQGEEEDERPSLLTDGQYRNKLPLPHVPKLLKILPDMDELCMYRRDSLDSKLRPCLLSNRTLLSRVNILDDDAYGKEPEQGSMAPPPPPIDAQLLDDDDVPEEVERAKKFARLKEPTEAYHRQAFGLQLPQLITNDVFTERQRFTTGRNAAEKKIYRDPPGFKSKEEVAQKIGRTFQAAKEEPVHPTKPHLKPKRVMQVVPDVHLWSNRYVQVAFDEQPKGQAIQRNDLLLRSAPDPRTTCFSLFKPRAGDADAYDMQQQYFWSNRGGFQQADEIGEGKTVVLAIPRASENGDQQRQQVKFMVAPTRMVLQKLKAHRLDIEEDTKALRVTVRPPPAAESADISASGPDSQPGSAQPDSAEPVHSAPME